MTEIHIKTKLELAKRLELSRTTLDRYLSKPGAPTRERGKGWSLAAVTAFIGEHADAERTRLKGSDALRRAKLREIELRCKRLAFALECDRGKFILVEDLSKVSAPTLSAFRTMVYDVLEVRAPMGMSGLGIAEGRIYGRRLADELLQKLQAVFATWPI